MSYFRAIVHKGEVSRRAFDLTSEVIQINPGFYTAW
jgi:protein farnesyltransferase/geranylgeranyltransferase type-1 subunit alpha